MNVVKKMAQMCSWGISSATKTTTSCSTASGSVMNKKTSMKCGQTSRSERLNALGTELSRRLMRGPTKANRVPTMRPGTTSTTEANALDNDQDPLGQQQPPPRQRPQHLQDGLGRFVALHRADQALEHAGVEGQPQGRRSEQDRPDDGPDAQVVDGDLGVEGALNGVESEDDEARHNHPGRFQPGGAPGHRHELQRVEAVALGGLGVALAHRGFTPSPTKSKRCRSGSKGTTDPTPSGPSGRSSR